MRKLKGEIVEYNGELWTIIVATKRVYVLQSVSSNRTIWI